MNTQSNGVPASPFGPQAVAPAVISETRPMYWSIRRELWENRSVYIAPLAVAAVYGFGFLISLFWVPRSMRRDRTILFWKSLPVSDLTTVLSKASIPLLVLPLLAFAITVALQLIMLLLNAAVLLASGAGTGMPWAPPLFEMELVTLYGTAALALWHAPIYCWFLLVSGWARRATFLWAVLPPLAIAAGERIAFHTSYFGLLMQDRLFGFAAGAFDLKDKAGVPIDAHFIPLTQLAPGRFLSSPGLWLGLALAAILLAAAVRLRRYQGPL